MCVCDYCLARHGMIPTLTVITHLSITLRSTFVFCRYLKQLQAKHPRHQLVETLATFDGAFDRVAATMAK